MTMTGPKQVCPDCGQVVMVKNRHPNFRQDKLNAKGAAHRHVSTTYTYACKCGKVFTRVLPVGKSDS